MWYGRKRMDLRARAGFRLGLTTSLLCEARQNTPICSPVKWKSNIFIGPPSMTAHQMSQTTENMLKSRKCFITQDIY